MLLYKTWGPGVKERKLAGWGLSRGKAWKGSLNVTEKNAPQMEANTGIMEDAPTMKLVSSCCIWRRSRQPKWNGSWKTSKLCILPGFHSPVMQKTLQIPLFLTRWTERGLNPRPQGYKPPGGGGVKSDSIRECANPAPGIFLAKARGTPASIASFREKYVPCRPIYQAKPCKTLKRSQEV